MPMRRRSGTASTPASYTSAPSSSTEPVTQAPSDSSCMRFRQRRKVLLPQPDGPITAVTVCAGNRRDTSFTTAPPPYTAVRRTASSWSRAAAGSAKTRTQGPAGRGGGGGAAAAAGGGGAPGRPFPPVGGAIVGPTTPGGPPPRPGGEKSPTGGTAHARAKMQTTIEGVPSKPPATNRTVQPGRPEP